MYCDCDKSIYANRQKESINTIDSGLTTRNKTFNEDSIAVSLFTNWKTAMLSMLDLLYSQKKNDGSLDSIRFFIIHLCPELNCQRFTKI